MYHKCMTTRTGSVNSPYSHISPVYIAVGRVSQGKREVDRLDSRDDGALGGTMLCREATAALLRGAHTFTAVRRRTKLQL